MNRRKTNFAEAAIAAVICAAGSSARIGGVKKEYCLCPAQYRRGKAVWTSNAAQGSPNECPGENDSGLTVLGMAVLAFAAIPVIETIVITVPADGEYAARKALPPELFTGKKTFHFVTGGATRQASVFNALTALAADAPDFVLIHDGARPWVSPSLIERIIAEVPIRRAVIPLLPLTETPKETDAPLSAPPISEGTNTVFIKRHLKRALVGAAQTPQAFAFPEIFAAHQKTAAQNDPVEYTDDAEIWASFYGPVAAIPGEVENRKITFPEDLT